MIGFIDRRRLWPADMYDRTGCEVVDPKRWIVERQGRAQIRPASVDETFKFGKIHFRLSLNASTFREPVSVSWMQTSSPIVSRL